MTTIPSSTPTEKLAKLLAQELNSTPTPERNKLLERFHGVEGVVSETEDLIESRLQELHRTLDQIPSKHAYNMASMQDEEFIQCRKLRLQFLRAESFDAVKAAKRMVGYFEEKLLRFGKDALARPLILGDLNETARTLLIRHATLQLLSSRDRVGRAILFCHLDASICSSDQPTALGDAAFYMVGAAAEDEETQKKGALTVTVIGNIPSSESVKTLLVALEKGGLWHIKSSPLRINANHIWTREKHDMSLHVMENLNLKMGKAFRLLSRFHLASFDETKRDMKTVGIPIECLPLSLDGCELRPTFHQKWIRYRPKKEAKMQLNPNFRGIDLPSCQDVCLQRGTSFHHHPGNLLMKALMEPLVDEYHKSSSGRRSDLNQMVIRAIHATGGRFLSRSDEGWFLEILDHAEVSKSVGASFRSLLSRTRQKRKRMTMASDGIHPPTKTGSNP
eukprot:Nitzschia sp. Nitz4//scaffold132_size63325//52945//54524//NITZ4_006297-RA/size63325-augustus-gene-0.6-mRNA-1//1//CDS//3329535335//3668//frame0